MEEKLTCSRCGEIIDDGDYDMVEGDVVCRDCSDDYCVICDHCGNTVWSSNTHSDENTVLCHDCFHTHYVRCYECDCIVSNANVYTFEGEHYCSDCYHTSEDNHFIHEYSYKPTPVFYGNGGRYFGVELEIDRGGKNDYNAEDILDIANYDGEHVYIKADGSLDEGFEIVTHPMTLDYHIDDFNWAEILKRCVRLGYRSHQTSTCGLHVHVNRDTFSTSRDEQDVIIANILYFVEHHWNELLKFSRRTESSMKRWASRYGYEKTGKMILDKAKNDSKGRYAAVNLCNYNTIEFRLFRGTLKWNTLIATLQLVDKICDTAIYYTEEELQKLSWCEWVSRLEDVPELIQYLKERQLYINDLPETGEEDV